jgi:hypothetical protein
MSKNLREAEKLAEQEGGVLPNPWRMIQMGHGGLYRYITRHRGAFKKFKFATAIGVDGKGKNKRTFNRAIREEHIETANNLARRHKGVPDSFWLNANGYSRLAAYIRRYPAVFKNLDGKSPKKKCV